MSGHSAAILLVILISTAAACAPASRGAPTPTFASAARATPTADRPTLDRQELLARLAERFQAPEYQERVIAEGQAEYIGRGRWHVSFLDGRWEIIEQGFRVFHLNQRSRFLEATLRT